MRIKEFLKKNCIKTNLQETKKRGHIKELVHILSEAEKLPPGKTEEVTDELMKREILGSTGIGEGVAIPHVRTSAVKEMTGALGISQQGVEFNALDGRPVHISFLLLTPSDERHQHLKALSAISLFLRDQYYREDLMNAKKPKEVYKIVKKI